jgi:hypothetical protein
MPCARKRCEARDVPRRRGAPPIAARTMLLWAVACGGDIVEAEAEAEAVAMDSGSGTTPGATTSSTAGPGEDTVPEATSLGSSSSGAASESRGTLGDSSGDPSSGATTQDAESGAPATTSSEGAGSSSESSTDSNATRTDGGSSTGGVGSSTGGVESSTGGVESSTGVVESSTGGVESSTGGVGSSTSGDPTDGGSEGAGGSSDTTGQATGSSSDTGAGPEDALYSETFDGSDGAPWPSPWIIVGDNVLSATIQGGRGELAGITGGTARMVLPGFAERDLEMTASIEFSDWNVQGFGLYARQNGGTLDQTDPPGQGYALFLEGFYLRSLGFWREIAGIETLISAHYDPIVGGVQPGVIYRLRYQVVQEGSDTALRGKVWLATDPEPVDWMIEILDDTPELQDLAGSFALDVYNWAGVQSVYVDDVEIRAL